ncbi:unnamed protein product [Psylliodes chrysocephalus]|uniref:SCAN domain-containing protein 3 n=1 Tax=Psylliodes chrysocephalus TaxID=3402493 RepID=A0A9P0DAC7_9CUCU|nr:unnamed protein product [Psylliodes chrysocephala]
MYLKQLNLKQQGKNGTMISNYDHIQGFISRLQLWSQKVISGNLICFPRLQGTIKNQRLGEDVKTDIAAYLKALKHEFQRYYSDINSESPIWHMTRNPFVVDVLQLPEDIQEEFLEMKADSIMKDDFHLFTLVKFWIKRFLLNPKVSSHALQIIVPFSSTYLGETGFSALVKIKTKQRNRLAVHSP